MDYNSDPKTYNLYFSIHRDDDKTFHLEAVARSEKEFSDISDKIADDHRRISPDIDFYYIGKINDSGLVQIRAVTFGDNPLFRNSKYNGCIYVPAFARIGKDEYEIIIDGDSFTCFMGLSGSTAVYIPERMRYIRSNPFYKGMICNIEVHPDNPAFAGRWGVLYDKTFTTLISYPPKDKSADYIEILSSVKTIGGRAFAFNSFLKRILLPPDLAEIGQCAFEYAKVKEVFIPASVRTIKPLTFYNCSELKRIVCCKSTKIEESAYPKPYIPGEKQQVTVEYYKESDEEKMLAKFQNRKMHDVSFSGVFEKVEKTGENIGSILKIVAVVAIIVTGIVGVPKIVDTWKPAKPNLPAFGLDEYHPEESPDTPEKDDTGGKTHDQSYEYDPHQYYTPGTQYGSDIIIDSGTQNDNSRWERFYKDGYAEMERQAERRFNSLTTMGYQYNDNGVLSGSTGRDDVYVAHQIADFYNYQHSMRDYRHEAALKGVNISQSHWETVKIN